MSDQRIDNEAAVSHKHHWRGYDGGGIVCEGCNSFDNGPYVHDLQRAHDALLASAEAALTTLDFIEEHHCEDCAESLASDGSPCAVHAIVRDLREAIARAKGGAA